MTKAELIQAVAQELGESRAGAARAVDAVLHAIVDGVHRDERVAITGFGTFRKKHRKARAGINPATKQIIEIKPSTTLGFTPSQSLRNGI